MDVLIEVLVEPLLLYKERGNSIAVLTQRGHVNGEESLLSYLQSQQWSNAPSTFRA